MKTLIAVASLSAMGYLVGSGVVPQTFGSTPIKWAPSPAPEPYLVISDGDTPKGRCNLGDLVRAAKAHMDLEHPVEPSPYCGLMASTCITQPDGTCKADYREYGPCPEIKQVERCGDEPVEYNSYTLTMIQREPRNLTSQELRERASCVERREKREADEAKKAEDKRGKVFMALETLRAEIARCEPKP